MNRPTTERVERPPSSFFTHNPSSPATFPTPGAQCGALRTRERHGKNGPDRTEAAETGRVDQTHHHPRFRRQNLEKLRLHPFRGSRGAGGLLAAEPGPGAGGRRAGGSPHRTAQGRPRDPPASQAQAAGEIRTARSRTHAKQRRHKCGFGAVRACVNCPLLPQRLRTGDDDAHRKTTASRTAVPRPRRAVLPPLPAYAAPERSPF